MKIIFSKLLEQIYKKTFLASPLLSNLQRCFLLCLLLSKLLTQLILQKQQKFQKHTQFSNWNSNYYHIAKAEKAWSSKQEDIFRMHHSTFETLSKNTYFFVAFSIVLYVRVNSLNLDFLRREILYHGEIFWIIQLLNNHYGIYRNLMRHQ